jgi:hypothetical protein
MSPAKCHEIHVAGRMVSIGFPPIRAGRDVSPPRWPECQHCEKAMTLLGKLPREALRPAVRVFRCHGCNRIAAEEI